MLVCVGSGVGNLLDFMVVWADKPDPRCPTCDGWLIVGSEVDSSGAVCPVKLDDAIFVFCDGVYHVVGSCVYNMGNAELGLGGYVFNADNKLGDDTVGGTVPHRS
mmetsp:Transcript_22282/g.35941  ORF Transcript_22282/g.35941 Transcript_22282/m.35941 type:complete len:105 (-) Transcript_22282:723-1037(-)